MENQQDMELSDLEVVDSVGAFESLISMKEKFKMYTKHFAKIFDIGNSGIPSEVSKGMELHTSKYIENYNNSNVDDNIITTSSNSTDINSHSLPIESRKITNTNSIKTQSETKTKPSDDTYVKNFNLIYKDSGKSEGSDKKTAKDYMARIEKFLYDFDKSNVLLNKPKRDEPNGSLELIKSSTSLDENNDEKKKIQSNMNCNVDETIKLLTPKTSHQECDEKHAMNQDLACILSDNSLLEKAMEQLRKKFKQFFLEFDMKTDTFKTPKGYQNHHQSSTKNDGNLRKTQVTNKGSKMNVLDTIELSRRSKKKQSRMLRHSESNDRLKISTGHFDIDGFCKRSNLPAKRDAVDAQKLRGKSENFFKVFSRTVKSFISISQRIRSNLGDITTKDPQENEDRRDGDEEWNSSTCNIAKGDDENLQQICSKIDQPMLKSSSSKNESSNLTGIPSIEINVPCSKIVCSIKDPGQYTNKESWVSDALKVMVTRSQSPMEKIKHNIHDCNFSDRSEKSPRTIDISNDQSNDINEYCSEVDWSGGSSNISFTSSNSKTSINEMNKYCGGTDRRNADFNVSTQSNKSKTSSRDASFILDDAIEDSNSSTETACSPHFQKTTSGDSIEFSKSIGRAIGETYAYGTPLPLEKITSSSNLQENDELLYDIGRSEECDGLPEREGSSQNVMISERRTQKMSNMHSLPVGNDVLIIDPSLSVSVEICNNLQSTCMYFDEKQAVSELVAVLLQRDVDMDDVLEKLGGYEDFEKALLFNSRMTSETNQTV